MQPLPTQLSGALFLANRKAALLADEPRVGKTGAAVIAADYVLARNILVVTTASGRAVWKRGLPYWSKYPRPVQVLDKGAKLKPGVPSAIVSWAGLLNPVTRASILTRSWDVVIGDEDHYAKNFDSRRAQAFYGVLRDDGADLDMAAAVTNDAAYIWPLSGTPAPNSLRDMYPRLRSLAPHLLRENPAKGWPDVTRLSAFEKRYCVIRPMKIGHGSWARMIDVVVGGLNEPELRERLAGFMLLRTQKEVGIRPPVYETFPLMVDAATRRKAEAGAKTAEILRAAEAGDTKSLEIALGPLRRLTGEIKAHAIVEAMKEDFACGLDKVVLMRWHKEPGAIIREGLKKYGVVSIDGSTSARDRQAAEDKFRDDPNTRVADVQIIAGGEAIDLSAASLLIFVESSFTPKDMKQASLRITNHMQSRQAFVRVAVLEGSYDEGLQTSLLRKWSSIREVLRA